ncbi:RagB/SusD family nutrient uptake outer membrane protein [Parapedobacter indicus]|uniref:Starch-binding associating with outer membrane n=1 Tax=Parapedobacter indicus TaxID=1477437 RepID=A0A1I3IAN3_9SPHI|nr:RagB/SusD family nutrient uptake outer membrane protein [Parapedobacter indicus]PPL02081.1 putative outer membrane starch-binding protein [Parapedobacter indicus]SFI44887.1 Starch-binding associating with outer membrane [Parapedobacter indicus]
MRKYLLIVAFAFAACGDLLDKGPLDIISEDAVYTDPVLAQAYVNNIYSKLSFLNREGDGFENVDPTSGLADEGRQGRSWHALYYHWKAGMLNENGGLMELWEYGNLRNINDFLEKIEEKSSFPDDTKGPMVAQMKFARALIYFYMAKRYGGIPIIDKPQPIDAPEEELFVSRNKEVDVYNFIINELDAIVDDLPPSAKVGYPSKYAALALKSRAALYAASIATWGEVALDGLVGIPASEADRFWQLSYDASQEIINSGVYSLYNALPNDKAENFRKLFVDENNSEVIFSWQLTGENVSSNYDLFMSPFQFCPGWGGSNTSVYLEMVDEFENIDGSSGKLNRALATRQPWDLRELFKDKDPRFHASVYYEGVEWKGESIENWGGIIAPDGTKITSGYYEGKPAQGRSYSAAGYAGGAITGFNVLKYLDETLIPVDQNKTKIDFIVFRLGEILLNKAEAALELGKSNEALEATNLLRARAGIKLLDEISREKVRHERKVELAFEDHRWWDLKRWRIAEHAITRTFTGIYTFYDVNTGNFKIEFNDNVHEGAPSRFLAKHYYFPITPQRIANNPNLAPDNPGY